MGSNQELQHGVGQFWPLEKQRMVERAERVEWMSSGYNWKSGFSEHELSESGDTCINIGEEGAAHPRYATDGFLKMCLVEGKWKGETGLWFRAVQNKEWGDGCQHRWKYLHEWSCWLVLSLWWLHLHSFQKELWTAAQPDSTGETCTFLPFGSKAHCQCSRVWLFLFLMSKDLMSSYRGGLRPGSLSSDKYFWTMLLL